MSTSDAKKRCCEICGFSNRKALHLHHIIPRTDPRCTDFPANLACICANCHNLVHSLEIIIEGRFQTTEAEETKLFWHKKGDDFVIRPGVILHADGTATVKEVSDE